MVAEITEWSKASEVAELINQSINDNYHIDENGVVKPWVCISCDGFIQLSKKKHIKTKRLENVKQLFQAQRKLPQEILKHYKYTGEGGEEFMKDILLSPSACYVKSKKAFSICSQCSHAVSTTKIPAKAISNGFEIGPVPKELAVLTDIEIAFISPIRVHGNIFTYFGGVKGIKGWHTFVKIDQKNLHCGLEQLDRIEDVPNQIAVVMSGFFTSAQRAKITKKVTVRREECKIALEWAIKNNIYSEGVTADDILASLPDPILIDHSTEVESRDANIERVEEFTVVFPDNTLTELNGGQTSVEDFEDVVKRVKESNGDYFVLSQGSEFVNDYKENNFSKAFPFQFCYGYGGPKDQRRQAIKLDDYLKHIINLSQPRFHEQLFSLVVYNIMQRQNMLKNATWRMKSKEVISSKFGQLLPIDVENTILAKEAGYRHGTAPSIQFVNLVDTITRCLPHTNEAAVGGRSSVMAMQCEYGFPSVFFTVTFSDDNSYVISLMTNSDDAGKMDRQALFELDSEEILSLQQRRKNTRSKYPGVCALNYELMVDVVIKCLIGWDDSKHCPTEKPGLFGVPLAYFLATEEQARKTLHAHFLIWIASYCQLMKDLMSEDRNKQVIARSTLKTLVKNSLSTDLTSQANPSKDFNHICRTRHTRKPVPVPLEGLRLLRHKDGCRLSKGTIATCGKCAKRWSSNELILEFVKSKYSGISNLISSMSSLNVKDKAILEQIIFASRHPDSDICVPNEIVQAVYNVHTEYHVKQCFKHDDECRYSLPQIPCNDTQIEPLIEDGDWASWTGKMLKRTQLRITPERGAYDVYMNTYCPAVSNSKLACNSNVRWLCGGSEAFYTTKYTTKKTQAEDTESYEATLAYTKKRLLAQKFEGQFSESLSRLLGAVIVHNSRNVISAPMAAYLSRSSRFRTSCDFWHIPLQDTINYLDGDIDKLLQVVKNDYKGHYFEVAALHYILRPESLEDVNLYEFIKLYEVITITKKNEDDLMKFGSQHPGRLNQGVRFRKKSVIPKVNNWCFPDSSKFGHCIISSKNTTENTSILAVNNDVISSKITIENTIEAYSQAALALFKPFRTAEDLQLQSSYVLCLQSWLFKLSTEASQQHDFVTDYLQNIQDIRNANKMPRFEDKLKSCTEPYECPESNKRKCDEMDEDDDLLEVNKEFLASLVDTEASEEHDVQSSRRRHNLDPRNASISLLSLRSKGVKNIGFAELGEACGISIEGCHKVEIEAEPVLKKSKTRHTGLTDAEYVISPLNLFKLIGQSVERITNVDGKRVIEVEALGTAKSIVAWGRSKGFDEYQQQAFEVMVASFILTFYDDIQNNCLDTSPLEAVNTGRSLRHTKVELQALCHKKEQLVMFLDGPGGSGKSFIIKEVLDYAKNFCQKIAFPFTEMTILVTATSGVAATLINGETVHRAVYLNRKKHSVTIENIEAYKRVRLIVVDEISMLPVPLLITLESTLRQLSQVLDEERPYGGFHIVFSGDFCQLNPIGKKNAIYGDLSLIQWHEYVNCYIELHGTYRFQQDPEWGKCLARFRVGKPEPQDFRMINQRVVYNGVTLDGSKIATNMQYATFHNRDRCAINTALFSGIIDHDPTKSIMVFSDNVTVDIGNGKKLPLQDKLTYWTECAESSIDFGQQSTKMDPIVKLYSNSPMMLTENVSVREGIANGTQATFQKLMLKYGEKVSQTVVDGSKVDCVFASQISYIQLCHTSGTQRVFKLEPKSFDFNAHFPKPPSLWTSKSRTEKIRMSATQLPVISNNATTGHKLQGSTKESIFITRFFYDTKNWNYVVLSRVRTRQGLFLKEPLDPSQDFTMDDSLVTMLTTFRQQKILPLQDFVFQ